MTSDASEVRGAARGAADAPEFAVPWTWGGGPPCRTPPVEVVLRAIRDDDYTELRAWHATVDVPAPPGRRHELRVATLLVLLGAACVLGGIVLLGALLVMTW